MKLSDIISNRIDRFERGYIFTYNDFNIEVTNSGALIKYLNRLVNSGQIKRLSKGRFYKPKETVFGELKPDMYQVVKDLLEANNKTQGYLTGFSIFNQLGLTTQVANTIQIGVNNEKKAITRGMYKIKFVKQANKITKENVSALQLLDCIKYIKDIPDTTQEKSCLRFKSIIQELNADQLTSLQKLALPYPPSTRALLGAIIEEVRPKDLSPKIVTSLNPASRYTFNIPKAALLLKTKWNIQ